MASKDEIAIKVSNLKKTFRIPLEKSSGIKQKVINILKGKKGYREFTPLNDISFEIKKGEFFGIVGRNGSGKSTLLKSIAGIYTPTSGGVHVNGKLVPFIELGVGFNAELTGRENVYLNGAMLGFSNKEVDDMYDEIVDFAELHDFMEESLKNYSSGMQVRLAFSIAIRAQGDVLLLDEVLAVGDEAFQRKCYEYFATLKQNKKTVVLVTHSMEAVQRFCTEAMLINDGKIISIGSPIDIAHEYSALNQNSEDDSTGTSQETVQSNYLKSYSVDISTPASKKASVSTVKDSDKSFLIDIAVTPIQTLTEVFFGLTIRKQSGELIYWYTTENPNMEIAALKANSPFNIKFDIQNILGEGLYEIGVYVKSKDRTKDYIIIDKAKSFRVGNRGTNGFMLHPNVRITRENDE